MATYYIKQKILSIVDRFVVKDASGADCYTVEGNFSILKNLTLRDMNGAELAQIKGRFSFLSTFDIYQDGVLNATVRQEPALFKTKLRVDGPNWIIVGNWMSSQFQITDMDGGDHARFSRELWTWGDSYRIDIAPGEPEILLLAIVIAIDAVIATQRAAAA